MGERNTLIWDGHVRRVKDWMTKRVVQCYVTGFGGRGRLSICMGGEGGVVGNVREQVSE